MGQTTGKAKIGNANNSFYATKLSLVAFGYVGQFQRNYRGQFDILKSPIIYLIIAYCPRRYEIYGIGYNNFGELGLGHSESILKYKRLHEIEKLLDHPSNIYRGYGRFMIKTIYGKLYCSGNNYRGDVGCNDPDSPKIERFTPILQNDEDNNFVCNVIGDGTISNHTIIVSNYPHNKFYAFGSNRKGQFDGTIGKESNFYPTQIFYNDIFTTDTIIKIKCGEYHTLFLTKNGDVFACGDNVYGQCGVGIKCNEKQKNGYLGITHIKELYNIVDIACGSYHNLCINDKHTLFVFGDNPYGQCGHQLSSENDENIICKPIECEYFKKRNFRITKIEAGNTHSCVLDLEGNCFLFGQNNYGQIGTGKDFVDYISTPHLINKLPKLNNILFDAMSAGYQHTVLLSQYNDIFTFGDNEYNQCSSECKQTKISHPWLLTRTEIGIDENYRIDSVVAGSDTTIIIIKM